MAVTGCAAPSIGFSCTSGNRPDQADSSLLCSASAPGPAGSTLYCCDTAGAGTAAVCGVDANVSCAPGTTGYTCPGGVPPPASLRCGPGVTGSNGSAGYCCSAATTGPLACVPDGNVTCTAGATGYTCPSGVGPPASVNCGAGVAGSGGASAYCCTAGTSPTSSSTCAPSGTVTCPAGSAGYSCRSPDTPWQATSGLICEPSADIGSGDYCCVSSANSCVQAPAIIDCPSGWYGVSCQGADSAMAASPSLRCAVDPNGGAMEFCCTTH